ncbi:hypothetical protein [Flavobacterium selenitireducens]|uniref:hypothetical protein n=1 Tax=Flavobacterium selenitireducens TaxID=2722704 RepID=UPI00168A903A|nr:hypothetical protein [Flavobacterium selenitireducens]MBD3584017.1 hypothetical protein [Flavobacterium selenitireducens]
MEKSLQKAQEVAHFALSVSSQAKELAEISDESNSQYQEILQTSMEIIHSLSSYELEVEDVNGLATLLEFVTKLCTEGSENYQRQISLLNWANERTDKYVSEYENLARNLGYDL